MFSLALYIAASALLILSFINDKAKTVTALKKAWKSLENILPALSVIILVIGLGLAVVSPAMISKLLGGHSGWLGMMVASIIGSISMVPGFVTFPLAAALLKNGAGFMQTVVFISTSMMVGVVTIPVEIGYFGRKTTLLRNSLAFIFSFAIAFVIGVMFR